MTTWKKDGVALDSEEHEIHSSQLEENGLTQQWAMWRPTTRRRTSGVSFLLWCENGSGQECTASSTTSQIVWISSASVGTITGRQSSDIAQLMKNGSRWLRR